jgi:hypothetical protein
MRPADPGDGPNHTRPCSGGRHSVDWREQAACAFPVEASGGGGDLGSQPGCTLWGSSFHSALRPDYFSCSTNRALPSVTRGAPLPKRGARATKVGQTRGICESAMLRPLWVGRTRVDFCLESARVDSLLRIVCTFVVNTQAFVNSIVVSNFPSMMAFEIARLSVRPMVLCPNDGRSSGEVSGAPGRCRPHKICCRFRQRIGG